MKHTKWTRIDGMGKDINLENVESTASMWKRMESESERNILEMVKEVRWTEILSPVQIQILQAIVYDGLTIEGAGKRAKLSPAEAKREYKKMGKIIQKELRRLDQ